MSLSRGIIESYDQARHSADVRLAGAQGRLADVPVLSVIPAEEMVAGACVVVAIWPDVGAVILGSYTDPAS